MMKLGVSTELCIFIDNFKDETEQKREDDNVLSIWPYRGNLYRDNSRS